MADHTRIEGGAIVCRYCNRTLTFNFLDRPATPCLCAEAVAVRASDTGGPIAQCDQCRQATPHPDEHWQFSDDGGWLCPDHASANGGPT